MATDYTDPKKAETYSEGIVSDKLSLRPVILNVIGNIKDKNILDLGCGSGKYSIVFAEMGAIVTGVDISKKQIELAQKINPHKNIDFLQKTTSTKA
jgi:2-polyprenyl-3-methyl-5-hydroxy-6-metoxy-1,4-benzoquinol methylase